MIDKMKELIPRQMFDMWRSRRRWGIKVIARVTTVKALAQERNRQMLRW